MPTTHPATFTRRLPTVEVGTPVRFDSPMSGWGRGHVVAAAPQRQVTGHNGRHVTWGDSTTHLDVTVEWEDGHADFGTAPGQTTVVSVGHSFAGTNLDTTHGGWPAGWKVG